MKKLGSIRWAEIVFALLAAILWFSSACVTIPPLTHLTWDGDALPFFTALSKQSRLNAFAAAFAAAAVFCQIIKVFKKPD